MKHMKIRFHRMYPFVVAAVVKVMCTAKAVTLDMLVDKTTNPTLTFTFAGLHLTAHLLSSNAFRLFPGAANNSNEKIHTCTRTHAHARVMV